VRDLVEQHRVMHINVPAPGHERSAVALDVGQRAESVVFQLEQPVWMIERARHAHERHRSQRGIHSPIIPRRPVEIWASGTNSQTTRSFTAVQAAGTMPPHVIVSN
jgi:hypothetical protein